MQKCNFGEFFCKPGVTVLYFAYLRKNVENWPHLISNNLIVLIHKSTCHANGLLQKCQIVFVLAIWRLNFIHILVKILKNGQNVDFVLIFDCVSQTFYTRDALVFIAVAGLHSEKIEHIRMIFNIVVLTYQGLKMIEKKYFVQPIHVKTLLQSLDEYS